MGCHQLADRRWRRCGESNLLNQTSTVHGDRAASCVLQTTSAPFSAAAASGPAVPAAAWVCCMHRCLQRCVPNQSWLVTTLSSWIWPGSSLCLAWWRSRLCMMRYAGCSSVPAGGCLGGFKRTNLVGVACHQHFTICAARETCKRR
jgi:hypothetical protein